MERKTKRLDKLLEHREDAIKHNDNNVDNIGFRHG